MNEKDLIGKTIEKIDIDGYGVVRSRLTSCITGGPHNVCHKTPGNQAEGGRRMILQNEVKWE